MTAFFRRAEAAILVEIRLTPGAGCNELTLTDTGLRARVTAAPEKGKANAALIKMLGKAWRLPKTSLTVVSGAQSRDKTVAIEGDSGQTAATLELWAQNQEGSTT